MGTSPAVKSSVSKPVAKPVSKPAPKTGSVAKTGTAAPKTGTDTTKLDTAKTKTGDQVDLSKESKTDKANTDNKAEENAYAGVADKTSEVTVDPYKKGKNDTIEGILRNQGYSLQDIYNKGKDGKTLIDHVASVNKLKNPNVIQDGAKLKIPGRNDSESLSSMDLKPGQEQTSKVENPDKGVSTDNKMEKKDDGSSVATNKTHSEKAPNADLTVKNEVGKDGRIDTNSTVVPKGVETNTVAQNKDGSAVTQSKIEAQPDKTDVTIKDIDKRPNNLKVTADADNVSVVNPGSKKAGDVKTNVDISESSSDGAFENGARWVAEKFGYKSDTPAPVSANGVGQVNVSKDDQGRATVTTGTGKDQKTLLTTAGDTDDTWLERRGQDVDNAIGFVGDKVEDGYSWLKGKLFGSEGNTQKSPVQDTPQKHWWSWG